MPEKLFYKHIRQDFMNAGGKDAANLRSDIMYDVKYDTLKCHNKKVP